MAKAKVIDMRSRQAPDVLTPWAALGFETERDMLLDDLKALNRRLKSDDTPAHAVAALSKRKTEVFEQIKHLDSDDGEDEILDDSDDEDLSVGS